MRTAVEIESVGLGNGPRILLLPGLGARGSGFRRLADALSHDFTPLVVEYPEGRYAASGPRELAQAVLDASGPVDAIVASSYGGLVAAHLVSMGAARSLCLIGSFTDRAQLGWRGTVIGLMGAIAELGRPGRLAACIASASLVDSDWVPHVVPTTGVERRTVLHRALATYGEPPPASLRDADVSCIAIHGALDVLVPVGVLPRVLESLPPGSPSHVIRNAGHVPYFTHAEECAGILREWLADARSARPSRSPASAGIGA